MLVPQTITAMRAAGTTAEATIIETIGTEAERAALAATVNTRREILGRTTIKETTVKMSPATEITETTLRKILVRTATEMTTILAIEDCTLQTTIPGHRGIETPGTITHRAIEIPITAVMPITVAVMMVETIITRRVNGRQSIPQGMINTILQGRGIRQLAKIPEDPIIPTTTVTLDTKPRGQGLPKILTLIT